MNPSILTLLATLLLYRRKLGQPLAPSALVLALIMLTLTQAVAQLQTCPTDVTSGIQSITVTGSTAKLPAAPTGYEWRPNGGNSALIDNAGNVTGLTSDGTYSFLLVRPGATCGSASQLTETYYSDYGTAVAAGFGKDKNGDYNTSFGTLADAAAKADPGLYGTNADNTLIFSLWDRTVHYGNTSIQYQSGVTYKMVVTYDPTSGVLTYNIGGQTLSFKPGVDGPTAQWANGNFMSQTMLYLAAPNAGQKVQVSNMKLNGLALNGGNPLVVEAGVGSSAFVVTGYNYYSGFNVTADVVFTYTTPPTVGGELFFDYKFTGAKDCVNGDDNGCVYAVSVTKTTPVCVNPTVGTPAVILATCNAAGTAANNDASIVISGITNGTSYAFTTDGSTPVYTPAQAVSGGVITLASLANPAAATTYTIRIFNGAADCFTDVTAVLNPKTCTPVCVNPTTGTPAVTLATCNAAGTAANNDASILIANITNGTSYAFTTDGSAPVYTPAQAVSGGVITLSSLANPAVATTYTIRIFSGAADCFTDVTAVLNPKTCTPTCVNPTTGTPAVTLATCNASGTAANNDASIFITNITNGTSYAFTTDGSAPAYTPAQTVSGGTITLSSLANPAAATTYTIRFFNGSASCFTDVTVTLDPKTCTCVNPTAGTPAVTLATCNAAGTAANNDASILIANINNGTSYAFTTDGSTPVYTPAQTVSGGIITLSSLSNPAVATTYTIRIFDAAASCFIDVTAVLNPKTCTPACVNPTVGTPAVTLATCNAAGTAANNDASIVLSGITNGTSYAFTTDGSAPVYTPAQTVSGGVVTLSSLVNPATATTYTIRVFNGSASCFTDVTAILNPKTCTPACAIAITGTPGTCDPATNLYTVTGTISMTSAVAGTATITDGTSTTTVAIAAGATSVPYSLVLTSNGAAHTISVSLPTCGSATATYTAPASCTVAPIPCAIAISATPGACVPATNQYTVTGTISLTSAVAGTATITDGTSTTTVSIAAGATSVSYSLAGFTSNGAAHTISVSLPTCGSATATYTAPVSCTVAPPVCSLTATATAGICASATNTYSATAVVLLSNPTAGVLTVTNGAQSLTFATTAVSSATFTATFNGLTSDGASHTMTATLPGCSTTTATYTAPASCSIAPVCSLTATATAGICASATSTYSATAVVRLTNPTAGVLTITNGAQSLTFATTAVSSATFTATFNGLNADGAAHTVTATLPGCSSTTTTYTAPASCSPTTAGLGNYVWSDTDKDGIQDSNEAGIPGVLVTLYTNGVASATTVTSSTGFYSFTGLTPGSSNSYVVGFTAPAGYTATQANAGSDDTNDSDADIITGKTQSVTLATGEFNPTLDAGFYGPPVKLTIDKLVNKSTAKIGDVLTYTIVLSNVGSTSATNVVVRDSSTTGLVYVANSATAPVGTTFTPGTPFSTWSVPTISAGQSLSLTFQAIADSSGILYNVATIPGDTAKVCTSIPVKMCTGDEYTLTVPTGRAGYRWYKDGVLIPGQTTNVLTITEPGAYSLGVDNASGLCPDFSCCPFILELDSLPVYQAVAVASTCQGNTPQNNGQLVLSQFNPTHTYQYSLGATFNPAASLSGSAKVIPASGVLATTLANPGTAQTYTVRVYNSSGCYTDMTVILMPTVCGCPADVCVPYVITQTKRPKRIGDAR